MRGCTSGYKFMQRNAKPFLKKINETPKSGEAGDDSQIELLPGINCYRFAGLFKPSVLGETHIGAPTLQFIGN